MDTYFQYLKNAYTQVIQSSLKDESLHILSQMENKEYYYKRVNELFTEIYSAQREDKIQELMMEVEKLKGNKNAEVKIVKEYIEKPCAKCAENRRKENRVLELQPNAVKDKINLALKQNQQLTYELKQANQSHLSQIQTISSIHQAAQTKMNLQITQLNKQCQEIHRKYKEMKENYINEMKKVQDLRKEVLNQRQNSYKYELKVKEVDKDRRFYEQIIEKLGNQIDNLKQCKAILEDKVSRLEDLKIFQKQKIQAYEKQMQMIKQENANIHMLQLPTRCSTDQQKQKCDEKNLQGLISSLTIKQKEIIRLKKDKQKLQQQNSKLNGDLIEYKLSTQKIIRDLKQSLNKTVIQYEKELRSYRDKQKLSIQEIRQNQLGAKLDQLQTLKIKVKALEDQKFELSNTIMKIQHSNQILTRNYEQLCNTLKNVQSDNEEKTANYEEKLEKYRKLERQLTKRIKMKEDAQYNIVEGELKDKIKYYSAKLEQTQAELERCRRSQQKLKKQLQSLQNHKKKQSLNEKNKELMLREHELIIKISDLEMALQQNKLVSKQLIEKKQQKMKVLKQQLQNKEQKITQLTIILQKQTQLRISHEKTQKQTQKLLRQEQQKVLSIQQRNRNQILQLMKNYEEKMDDMRKQFLKFDGTILKNKCEGNEKNSIKNSLKSLQKQYEGKINSLEQQWREMKANNFTLSQKYRQAEAELKICKEKLTTSHQQLRDLKNKQYSLNQNIQNLKNRQVQIIKHYQTKINNFKAIFHQFKSQICHQFLQSITQIRTQIYEMKKNTLQISQIFKKIMVNGKYEINQRIQIYYNSILKSYEFENKKINENTFAALEKEKQELRVSYENKLKQKQMDMMTIMAEKQFAIQEIKENQTVVSKKYKELEGNYKKMTAKLQKSEKTEYELKEIIQKMQNKVDDAQKNLMVRQKQVIHLQKTVQELSDKFQKCEIMYKKQMQECKQKYRQQNQRMFNRFQREFNKIVSINTKKSKDKISMAMMLSKNSEIPTKGNQQDKIVKLKRQIQQQKRIVQYLQNKNKL